MQKKLSKNERMEALRNASRKLGRSLPPGSEVEQPKPTFRHILMNSLETSDPYAAGHIVGGDSPVAELDFEKVMDIRRLR